MFVWNRILVGHVLDKIKEIPDNSIDCIVTSPPYWGLRDYDTEEQIWGGWVGSLGLEPTYQMFVDHLIQIFEALRPKLCDHGSLWVNLGDTYYGGGNASGHTEDTKQFGISTFETGKVIKPVARGKLLQSKTLVGIPDRFKIAMIDNGWICRNEIIWHKLSTMPSSAKDRFTVDFEKFFFFTKKGKYYFKQQFEKMQEDTFRETKRGFNQPKHEEAGIKREIDSWKINPLGRNMRTTWTINPKAFTEAHFAVFPQELIKTPIDACCPKLVCIECKKPQEIKYESEIIKNRLNTRPDARLMGDNTPAGMKKVERPPSDWKPREKEINIIKCDCNAEFRKGRVLDPFMGSGTTAIEAYTQGKDWLGIELNPKYAKMAERRFRNNTSILLDNFFEEN